MWETPVAIYVVNVCNARFEQFVKGILIVYNNICIFMILIDQASPGDFFAQVKEIFKNVDVFATDVGHIKLYRKSGVCRLY